MRAVRGTLSLKTHFNYQVPSLNTKTRVRKRIGIVNFLPNEVYRLCPIIIYKRRGIGQYPIFFEHLIPGHSGKRRRSWRTQKYLLSDPIFSQQIIADIHKSFSEANCILKMGNIWRSFWYAIISILLLSAGCSHQGDINPRNLLLDSRYKTPPKIGLDWLNKNGNDDLFPEKTTFVVHPKKKSKGRAFGGLKTG